MSREVSLLDKCLVVLLVVAVAGVVLVLANSLMAKQPTASEAITPSSPSKPSTQTASCSRLDGDDTCFSSQSSAVSTNHNILTVLIDSTCPAPTQLQDGKCVLNSDVTLNKTLRLSSNTTLDCQGHKLSPASPGINDNLNTNADEHLDSDPYVAILLNNITGVTIRNCTIDGFDFGIFGMNGKVSASDKSNSTKLALLRNKIKSNTIRARYYDVQLQLFDNSEVEGNNLTVASAGGINIDVRRNGDLNRIRNNTITINNLADFAPDNPQGRRWFKEFGLGIDVSQVGHPFVDTFFNIVIDGQVYPISAPMDDQSEDNLIEGNTVLFNASGASMEGIGNQDSPRTVIRGNTISGFTFASIFDNRRPGLRQFPGFCSKDSGRFCLRNSDCNIPEIDDKSKGQCVLPGKIETNWTNEDTVIENNTISLFSVAAIWMNDAGIIRGNNLTGTGAQAGISLGGIALETATVARNSVSGAKNALLLHSSFFGINASFFGANVSLNDFIAQFPIGVSGGYNFTTELSVDGKGNYWGRTCADSDGFRDADEGPGRTDSPLLLITDSHPYNQSVANEFNATKLNQTCS
jgi:hypothetical protein